MPPADRDTALIQFERIEQQFRAAETADSGGETLIVTPAADKPARDEAGSATVLIPPDGQAESSDSPSLGGGDDDPASKTLLIDPAGTGETDTILETPAQPPAEMPPSTVLIEGHSNPAAADGQTGDDGASDGTFIVAPAAAAGEGRDSVPDSTRLITPGEDDVPIGATVFDPSVAAEASSARAAPRLPGYQILGELGRVGVGVVYRARQTGLNRTVALKMILSGAHAGADQLERFRLEAQAGTPAHRARLRRG